MNNNFKLSILKNKKYISVTKYLLRSFLKEKNIKSDIIDTAVLSIEELLSNIIIHSENNNDFIEITIEKTEELIINISNFDKQFEFDKKYNSGSFKKQFKGGGLHIIKNLTKKFEYKHINGKNIFTLNFS